MLPLSGGLAQCRFREQEIFRPTPQGPFTDGPAADLCYYPLVPFANRIRNGRFEHDGRTLHLEPNVRGHPHPLHGHGWRAEWQVLHADDAGCTLCFEHHAEHGWPWPYRATEKLSIEGDVLALELAVRNLSSSAMPTGLGFHPFFPHPATATLRAAARALSVAGAEEFPRGSGPIPPALDFAAGRLAAHARGLDHCYSGWSGAASIDWTGARWRVQIAAARLEHLHVYVPDDRDFFCVEPVSHPLDAFNFTGPGSHPPLALAPGADLTVAMTIRCEPAAPG